MSINCYYLHKKVINRAITKKRNYCCLHQVVNRIEFTQYSAVSFPSLYVRLYCPSSRSVICRQVFLLSYSTRVPCLSFLLIVWPIHLQYYVRKKPEVHVASAFRHEYRAFVSEKLFSFQWWISKPISFFPNNWIDFTSDLIIYKAWFVWIFVSANANLILLSKVLYMMFR